MLMRDLAVLDDLLTDWLREYPNRWEMPVREVQRIIHNQVEDAREGAKYES